MGQAPPVTRFTLAVAAGVAVRIVGAPLILAPLFLLLLAASPIRTWIGPARRRAALLGLPAGMFLAVPGGPGVCGAPPVGVPVTVEGHLHAMPRFGSAPLERTDGCGVVTVVLSSRDSSSVGGAMLGAGRPVRVSGSWQEGTRGHWLRARAIVPVDGTEGGVGPVTLRWVGVRWRDALAGRLHRLYGDRAPLVTALTLARREGLDREVRDAFAVTGVAHLLAISGFHVGLITAFVFVLLRTMAFSRRNAQVGAAVCAWGYVALIGFPAAACRAAVILSVVATSGLRGRPSTRWGGLSAAALLLLLADPSMLESPGFQLSFAGAMGLVAWAGSTRSALSRVLGARTAKVLASPVAAGVAATLGTLPLVAWHFERVSLVGIPMTLLATPVVSLALPGALASLLLDFVSGPAASFVAGGVSVLLDLLVGASTAVTRWSWASVPVTRMAVVGGCVGVFVATWVARHPRVRGRTRRSLVVLYLVGGVVAWPVVRSWEGRGRLELLMIDVGQGDAIAVRTPRGRWVLVDAGPEAQGSGRAAPAPHPVVRTLRARGVAALELLILSHPDLDHFGGARAVLDAFTVHRVLDPALPAPKEGYVDLLEDAGRRAVPWAAARRGDEFSLDGVRFRVLHPDADAVVAADANEASVVLLVSWGDFHALLTGDAGVEVERALLGSVPDLDVLKVGHHGSTTSTDSLVLVTTKPEIALVSAGRRNRYGHPAPAVLARLESAGVTVYRTDRHGAVRVLVARDGAVRVVSDR